MKPQEKVVVGSLGSRGTKKHQQRRAADKIASYHITLQPDFNHTRMHSSYSYSIKWDQADRCVSKLGTPPNPSVSLQKETRGYIGYIKISNTVHRGLGLPGFLIGQRHCWWARTLGCWQCGVNDCEVLVNGCWLWLWLVAFWLWRLYQLPTSQKASYHNNEKPTHGARSPVAKARVVYFWITIWGFP